MAVEAGYEEAVRLLIRLLHDGVKGFRTVAGMLHGEEFRRFYLEEADVRAAMAAELERTFTGVTGLTVRGGGTMMGPVHRAYFELRDAMGAGDEKLLDLSEQCERLLTRMYLDALAKEMPDVLRAVLVQHDEHIRRVHAMVRRYRTDARLALG